MKDNKYFKKYIQGFAFWATVIGSVVANEQILLKKLKNQKEEYETQKDILEKKISELNEKNKILSDTSFRFYEHLVNGANYEEFKKVSDAEFVRNSENIYEKYRPQALSEDLILSLDSACDIKKVKHNTLFDKQMNDFEKFSNSDTITDILKNGQIFLNSTLELMAHQNKALGNSLTRILNNSDEENDREFKARYFMFKVKTKNQMYSNSYNLMSDYYKAIFLKNTTVYKRTASYLNNIVDSLSLEYEQSIEKDSVEFERKKNQKLDSILNNPPKEKNISFKDYALIFKNWNDSIRI
ncbi:MAG: hypothetical protein IKW39_00250 [Alphaproteobacteria bacterium]|nr:hypothetical protein [Alphaproteobacteria bacterium]